MRLRRVPAVQRVEYLTEACRGRRVLHLGCTDAPYTQQRLDDDMLLHRRLSLVADELWGLDSDEPGLERLRREGFRNLALGDVESRSQPSITDTFDVVVAGEIIEHLSNPGLFLECVRRYLGPHSALIVTTVNAYCALRFAVFAVRGRGGELEPVHPDHVAYYSRATLARLLARGGFTIDEERFYDLGVEHRPYVRRRLRMLNDVAVRLSPQLADGVIARCRALEQ